MGCSKKVKESMEWLSRKLEEMYKRDLKKFGSIEEYRKVLRQDMWAVFILMIIGTIGLSVMFVIGQYL